MSSKKPVRYVLSSRGQFELPMLLDLCQASLRFIKLVELYGASLRSKKLSALEEALSGFTRLFELYEASRALGGSLSFTRLFMICEAS